MELASLLIALISLAVAGGTAWKAGLLQRQDLLLARRLELHGLLQGADRLLFDYPQLSRAFRSSEEHLPIQNWTPAERDMFRNYVVTYLNVFEAAYSVFEQTSRLDKAESKIRDAWRRTVVSFFADCPAAREVWAQYRETYYDEFQAFVEGAVRADSAFAPGLPLPSSANDSTTSGSEESS